MGCGCWEEPARASHHDKAELVALVDGHLALSRAVRAALRVVAPAQDRKLASDGSLKHPCVPLPHIPCMTGKPLTACRQDPVLTPARSIHMHATITRRGQIMVRTHYRRVTGIPGYWDRVPL